MIFNMVVSGGGSGGGGDLPWQTFVGNPLEFDAPKAHTLQSVTVGFEPIQDTSGGDPSPSNICPITGWTGCNVTRAGKNILDISRFATEYPNYCTYSDGVLSVTANGVLYSTGISVNIPAGTTLNWTITNGTSTSAKLRFLYSDNSVLSITSPIPYTTPKDIIAVRMDWSSAGTFTVKNVQAELGSTATTYEPYNGQTCSVSWQTEAGTVYGGTIDVATGVLTVTRVLWTKNTSTMDNSENYPGWANSGIKDLIGEGFNTVFQNQIMNIGDTFSANTTGTRDILFLSRTYYGSSMTQTAWQTLAIDVQIAVELATPQTYQLTPQQVQAIVGLNVMWTDCTSLTVQARGTNV